MELATARDSISSCNVHSEVYFMVTSALRCTLDRCFAMHGQFHLNYGDENTQATAEARCEYIDHHCSMELSSKILVTIFIYLYQ